MTTVAEKRFRIARCPDWSGQRRPRWALLMWTGAYWEFGSFAAAICYLDRLIKLDTAPDPEIAP